MIILGLGSNQGDRLAHLRRALLALRKLKTFHIKKISPLYYSDALLPENAPDNWNQPYLNLAVTLETVLNPEVVLQKLKQIEASLGRDITSEHWAPRIIDIDLLAWHELNLVSKNLTLPHPHLLQRPFALWPLADIAPLWQFPLMGTSHGKTAAQLVEKWGSRFDGYAPFHTRQIYQRVDTPQLVGILNITPDSFSDGGLYVNPEKALKQAIQLVADGAFILDIGAESTSPKACPIEAKIEWQRLETFLSCLMKNLNQFIVRPKISIDTRHAFVAERALNMNVDWINDVSGLDDPAMRDLIKQTSVDCVVMHHLHLPERREQVIPRAKDPIKTVYAWGKKRLDELTQEGIPLHKIIFDPGIGFGKMAEQSLVLLQKIAAFKKLGTRILIGHSRKTFLSLLSARSFAERDIETLSILLSLAHSPVDYFRVHNVSMCARGLNVSCFFNDSKSLS